MTQELSETPGKVLYSEPSLHTVEGVQYRTVCRLHSNGWSKTVLRRDNIYWVTVAHSEEVQVNPLSQVMKGL